MWQPWGFVNYLNNGGSDCQKCFTHSLLEKMHRWVHGQLTTSTEAQLSEEEAALLSSLSLPNKKSIKKY